MAGTGPAPPEPDPRVVDAIRGEMDFPPFQPPIQEHLIGADGGLWLQREDRGGETLDWVVLDPNGRARGVLTLPSRVRPAWTNGDDVLAVETGDLDVPWLVRYRLSGS